MSYEHQLKREYHEGNLVSIPCIALCLMLVAVLGYLPALPSSISQVFRPILIVLCFLIPSKLQYRFSITDKALILYLAYFLMVFLVHPITKDTAMAYGAALLFGFFFIILAKRYWNKREIQAVLFSVALACTIFAVILYRENPDMLHNHPYGGFTFRGYHINDNAAAFELVPGILCSLALLLFHHPNYAKKRKRGVFVHIALLCSAVFCMFVVFCIGARSAFFSAVLGSVCIVYQKTRTYHSSSARMRALVIMVLSLVILIGVGMHVTEGTHSARLFDIESLDDTNGRDDLADEARPMIHKKPLFGGGYNYWAEEGGSTLGTHNTFLTVMVRGGYIGGVLLFFFLCAMLIETVSTKNFLLIAFLIETVLHTLTESDLDYFAYIPLLITFILLRYAKIHNCAAEEIL